MIQGRLAGAVGGHARDRVRSGQGRDHEDVAASLRELREGGSGQAEDGREVRVEDALPLVVGRLRDRSVRADPGVVDQDLQAAVRLARPRDRARADGGIAHVARVGSGAAPGALDLGGEGLEIGSRARDAGHGGARATQGQGDRAPDTAAGPGDESRRAAQLHVRSIPIGPRRARRRA